MHDPRLEPVASKALSAEAVLWLRTVLTERYGLPVTLERDLREWRLSLSGSEQVVRVAADGEMFQRANSDLPFASWDAAREGWLPVLSMPLPAPGMSVPCSPIVEQADGGYVFHYDVLGLVYWMLTRQEEVGRTDLDPHGRFRASSSHAYKYAYLKRPIVDEWLDLLGQVIQRTWPAVSLKRPQFGVGVSHDVDSPTRYGFRSWSQLPLLLAGDLVLRRDARGLMGPWIRLNTRSRLHAWDAYNTFDWLMERSEHHRLTSAFYFIGDRCGTAHDSEYDLEHPAIRNLLRRIHQRGHEIGLHPSYGTFLDPGQISREADRLRRVCSEEGVKQDGFGGRMHYLQWRQPITPRAWEEAGMRYDSTLGYADQAGFRCGTCFEYPGFDPVAQKALRLRFRPLVAMDTCIMSGEYMNLGVSSAARDKLLDLKGVCRAVGGRFTLLWHNSNLRTQAERRLYEAVLEGEGSAR